MYYEVRLVCERIEEKDGTLSKRVVNDIQLAQLDDDKNTRTIATEIFHAAKAVIAEHAAQTEVTAAVKTVVEPTQEEPAAPTSAEIKLSSLELSTRFANCTKNSNIETVSQLADMTKEEFKHVKNVGAKTITEAVELLARYGLKFKGEI